MNGRVDPSTPLRKQDLGRIGSDSLGMGVANKFGFVRREVLEYKGGQVTILTQMQEILQMKRVDAVFGIVVDDLIRYE